MAGVQSIMARLGESREYKAKLIKVVGTSSRLPCHGSGTCRSLSLWWLSYIHQAHVCAQYITDRRVPHISHLATTKNIKPCKYLSTSLPDMLLSTGEPAHSYQHTAVFATSACASCSKRRRYFHFPPRPIQQHKAISLTMSLIADLIRLLLPHCYKQDARNAG